MKKFSHIRVPSKLKKIYKDYENKEFTLLDVGCGDHSPSLFERWFPKIKYFGLDRTNYNNSDKDFNFMEKFYKIDLSAPNFDDLEDNFFDVIFMSHVIEHLENGLEVLNLLSKKLKKDGKIYLEFPSTNSLGFPSARGTLNFSDDPTHIKLYDIKEIANELMKNNFKIIKAGISKDFLRILIFFIFLPYQIYSLIKHKKINSKYGAWDFFNFSHYVYAKKK